jgi:hypothetical protein
MLPPLFLVVMLLGMATLNLVMRIGLRLPWYSKSYRMACEALGGSCTSTPFRSSNESKKFQKWKTVNGESVAVLSPAPENGDSAITYEGDCGFKSPEVVPVRWRATAKRRLDAAEEIEFATHGLNQLVGQGLVWKLKPEHTPITVLLENGRHQETRVWRGARCRARQVRTRGLSQMSRRTITRWRNWVQRVFRTVSLQSSLGSI